LPKSPELPKLTIEEFWCDPQVLNFGDLWQFWHFWQLIETVDA
jgi:hypothetical protein